MVSKNRNCHNTLGAHAALIRDQAVEGKLKKGDLPNSTIDQRQHGPLRWWHLVELEATIIPAEEGLGAGQNRQRSERWILSRSSSSAQQEQ